MSQTDPELAVSRALAREPAAATGTRVDPAHRMGGSESPPASPEGLDERPEDRQQVEAQARELADHLRDWQQELNRRDDQLRRQLSELDNERRSARLWAEGRQQALAEREMELDDRELHLESRAADLLAVERRLTEQRLAQEQHHRVCEAQWAARESQLTAVTQRLRQQAQLQSEALSELQAARQQAAWEHRRLAQQTDARRESSLALIRLLLAGVERRRQAVEASLPPARRAAGDGV